MAPLSTHPEGWGLGVCLRESKVLERMQVKTANDGRSGAREDGDTGGEMGVKGGPLSWAGSSERWAALGLSFQGGGTEVIAGSKG